MSVSWSLFFNIVTPECGSSICMLTASTYSSSLILQLRRWNSKAGIYESERASIARQQLVETRGRDNTLEQAIAQERLVISA
jgi:hypothetical protein